MKTTVIYLDLDRALYDTDRFFVDVCADLRTLGHSDEEIARVLYDVDKKGYSFDEHLRRLGHPPDLVRERAEAYRRMQADGDRYLFPGVADGVRALAEIAECRLLTYGHPPFQEAKFNGVTAFSGIFAHQHYIWGTQTKGDVITQNALPSNIWFLDDSPEQLIDVRRKAPQTRCVRMRCTENARPHPDDNRAWEVVMSIQDFVRLVRRTIG